MFGSSRPFTCSYCGKPLSTQQGLKSHISSSLTCSQSQKNARTPLAHQLPSQTSFPSPQKNPVLLPPLFPPPLLPLDDVAPPPKRHRPTIEEVPDEGDLPQPTHLSYSGPVFADFFPTRIASTYGHGSNSFETRHCQQEEDETSPFFPFRDREEWELGSALMTSDIAQAAIDKILKLDIVSPILSCTHVQFYF